MTSDGANPPTDRSKEDLRDLIDHELRRAADDARVSGLTIWGLAATLGVLIAAVADAWSHVPVSEIRPSQVVLWFVLFSYAWDQVSTRFQAGLTLNFGPGVVRFRTIDMVVSGWPQFVVVVGRLAIILGLALDYRALVPWWGVTAVVFYYAQLIVGAVVVAIMSLREFPLPVVPGGTMIARMLKKASWPARVTDLGVMVIGFIGYGSALSLPRLGTSVASIRLAALLTAIGAIGEVLALKTWRSPLIHALEDLRRKLAFSTVSTSAGFAEAEAILYGLRGDALLQRELADVFQLFDFARNVETTAASLASQIQTLGGSTSTASAIEQATSQRLRLTHQYQLLASAVEQLDELMPKLHRHFKQILSMDPSTAHTSESIRAMRLDESRDEARERLNRVAEMMKTVDAAIAQARRVGTPMDSGTPPPAAS